MRRNHLVSRFLAGACLAIAATAASAQDAPWSLPPGVAMDLPFATGGAPQGGFHPFWQAAEEEAVGFGFPGVIAETIVSVTDPSTLGSALQNAVGMPPAIAFNPMAQMPTNLPFRLYSLAIIESPADVVPFDGPGLPPFGAGSSSPPVPQWATPPAFLTTSAVPQAAQAPAFNPGLPPFGAGSSSPPVPQWAAPPAFLMTPAAPQVAQAPAFNPGLPPFGAAPVAVPPVPGLAVQDRCAHGTMLGRFYFITGSARLNPEAVKLAPEVAARLKQCPNLAVQVSGHTDNVGSANTNMYLARRRALAIIAALEKEGIAGQRLNWVSKGLNEPIASNETEAGRALNRRIEVTIQ